MVSSGKFLHVAVLVLFLTISQASLAAVIGDVAPPFEIQTIEGKPLSLAEYQGKKVVYLVFWNTWCSYCIKKTPRYKKLAEVFGDRIEIIAINTGWSDSATEIERFRNQHETNYPLVYDAEEVITGRYKVHAVPTEFVIDLDGIIRHRDHVPNYVAAHIPDWFEPYIPGKDHGAGLVNACEFVTTPPPVTADNLAAVWLDDFK